MPLTTRRRFFQTAVAASTGAALVAEARAIDPIRRTGKSQIHCSHVACATTGGKWPDGSNGVPPGNVIMLTAEDCLDQTIVPRLIAAGADRGRVYILKKIRKLLNLFARFEIKVTCM